MTLRARLMLLVIGIILMPFLLGALVAYLHGVHLLQGGPREVRKFFHMREWLAEDLPRAWQAGRPQAAGATLPAGIEVIVAGVDGRVVLATIPGFQAGERIKPIQIYESLVLQEKYTGIMNPVVVNEQVVGMVLQRHLFRDDPAIRLSRRLEGLLLYVIGMVAIATVLVMLGMNSLRRGIGRLQRATARVAAGDLDFELQGHGKDELAALSRSFEQMRRALREEQAMRSRFLMAVSHDLKTPLTAIEGYLEAINDGLAEDPEVLSRHLAIVAEKSRVLEGRISELIEYVKMSTGQWRLRHRPINLQDFLTEVGRVYAADAPVFHRSFSSRIELPRDLEVSGDRSLLLRAFDNLFHNALRYTREGDAISLEARLQGRAVLIRFADNGPGVSAEELTRIFEPLYRGTGSRREPGTGLGLATVHSLLTAHGWGIEASSDPGQGLAFTIRLQPALPGDASPKPT